jgi:hypothetical protein
MVSPQRCAVSLRGVGVTLHWCRCTLLGRLSNTCAPCDNAQLARQHARHPAHIADCETPGQERVLWACCGGVVGIDWPCVDAGFVLPRVGPVVHFMQQARHAHLIVHYRVLLLLQCAKHGEPPVLQLANSVAAPRRSCSARCVQRPQFVAVRPLLPSYRPAAPCTQLGGPAAYSLPWLRLPRCPAPA